MEFINYNDLYKRTNSAIEDRNQRAKEMGYKDYNDYLDSLPPSISREDAFWEFSKDYNSNVKDNLRSEDFIKNQKEPNTLIFEGKKNLDSIVENNDILNINTVMKIVKAAYKDENELTDDETEQQLDNGKNIVKEMIQKGVNKEQIILMLLKEEKAWTQKLVREAKKKENRNEEVVLKGEKSLKNIYKIKKDLNKIKSPYDNLLDMSAQIDNLEKLQSEHENSFNSYENKQAEIETRRVIEENQSLNNALTEFDSRIIYDVVKDRVESKKLELEINQLKTGQEISEDFENQIDKQISELKQNLKPLMKIVKQNVNQVKQRDNYLDV